MLGWEGVIVAWPQLTSLKTESIAGKCPPCHGPWRWPILSDRVPSLPVEGRKFSSWPLQLKGSQVADYVKYEGYC